MTEFNEYDHGFRLGTFDKCNGKPCLVAGDGNDSLWDGGYLDGWNGNENQFPDDEIVPTGSTFDTDPTNSPQLFFKLWIEWDLGQDEYIFDSEQAAMDWMNKVLPDQGFDDPELDTAQKIFDEGLAGLDIVELIR